MNFKKLQLQIFLKREFMKFKKFKNLLANLILKIVFSRQLLLVDLKFTREQFGKFSIKLEKLSQALAAAEDMTK